MHCFPVCRCFDVLKMYPCAPPPPPSPELVLADHLSQVLDDELPRTEGLLGADAPALALGAEALQTLHPLVPLDVLVVALLTAWADAGGALSKAHSAGKQCGTRWGDKWRGIRRFMKSQTHCPMHMDSYK